MSVSHLFLCWQTFKLRNAVGMVAVLHLQRAPLFTFGVCRPRVILGPHLVLVSEV